MASVFSHRDDDVIRPGDFVRTTLTDSTPMPAVGAHSSNLSRSSIHNTSGRNSAPPGSASVRQQRRSKTGDASPGLGGGGGHHHHQATTNISERSAVCDMFKADTSSLDAWWTTMTRGTWLQQSTEAARVGVVRAVNLSQRTVEVTVWMLGDRCLVDLPKKPVETYPVGRLEKLSTFEFNETCRKRYMHEMAHHLKLRGEGYDESAPFALIAHNNRVISDLIGKIDTSAKLSMKDIVVRRPRGPADLINRPIPVMVPIEDPLAAARGELQALQESGLVQGTRRRRHQTSEVSSQHKSASDDTLVHGTERHVSTPMVGGDSYNSGTAGSPSLLLQTTTMTTSNNNTTAASQNARDTQRSFFELTVSDETSTTQRNLRASSALSRPNAGLRTRQPLVPDTFFIDQRSSTSGAVGANVVAGGVPPRGNKSKRGQTFLTNVHSIDASVMERHHVMCTVVDVMEPRGYILLRPSRTSEVPFVASLAFVDIWQDKSAIAAIRALTSVEVKVFPRSRDLYGNCLCDIHVSGECLAETLLGEGLASLNVSALDGELLRQQQRRGSDVEEDNDDETTAQAVPERLEELQAAQDRASRHRLGLWEELLQPTNDSHGTSATVQVVANQRQVVGDTFELEDLQTAKQRRASASSTSSSPLIGSISSLNGAVGADDGASAQGRRRRQDAQAHENHLPPLFSAFEASHAFRQKVASTFQ